jgi:hypothetical protein
MCCRFRHNTPFPQPTLLGAYTMEGFWFAPDPLHWCFVPVPGQRMPRFWHETTGHLAREK